MDVPQQELPRYKSHKTVWALKIKSIEQAPADQLAVHPGGDWLLVPEEPGYGKVLVGHDYYTKHRPAVGGYYVVYKGGYQSFCPGPEFEEGNRLEPKHVGTVSGDVAPDDMAAYRGRAAQAWCTPANANTVMDSDLALAFADILAHDCEGWKNTARHFSEGSDFYRGIVRQIGEMFGVEAKTSDDGSVQSDVLALKVPGLVAALLAKGALTDADAAADLAGTPRPDHPTVAA